MWQHNGTTKPTLRHLTGKANAIDEPSLIPSSLTITPVAYKPTGLTPQNGSGASYPAIGCGDNGKLYVFYVRNGKIWIKHFNGLKWLKETELFTRNHTYNNPAYLSTNQNAQNGKICLVWTEGTSPYEVWFSYLED